MRIKRESESPNGLKTNTEFEVHPSETYTFIIIFIIPKILYILY